MKHAALAVALIFVAQGAIAAPPAGVSRSGQRAELCRAASLAIVDAQSGSDDIATAIRLVRENLAAARRSPMSDISAQSVRTAGVALDGLERTKSWQAAILADAAANQRALFVSLVAP